MLQREGGGVAVHSKGLRKRRGLDGWFDMRYFYAL